MLLTFRLKTNLNHGITFIRNLKSCKFLTVYRRILYELCVGRTSLYICAQLNSSGGGNTSTVHKRSTCSTYWRMVPLQRGLKIQRRRYSQSGFHTLTTEARVRFIVWETLFLWHLLFIWERHCVNFCIFKILGFFLSTILMTKNYRMCDFQTFVLTPWHWGRRDRDRIVVGFTTTYAISAYHY